MKKLLELTVLTTLLASSSAMALTQKIDLDLNSSQLHGTEEVPLKRMLIRSVGGRTLRGWTLKGVEVEAKSMHGNGAIALQVGHADTLPELVPGNPEDFESDYFHFHTIHLDPPFTYRGERDQGQIKLLTKGILKLDDVEVTLHKHLNYDHLDVFGLSFQDMGTFKATKIIGKTKTYHINGPLKAIKVKGEKKNAHVKAEIKFMDGQVVILDEMDGKVREGGEFNFALKGELAKPVDHVKIDATSARIFGSSSKVSVHLSL